MSVLSSEIVLYQALNNTATTANGGRRSGNLVVSGAANGLFPFILPEDRIAGARHLRKIFPSINNAANETLYGGGIYIDAPTPGADYCTLFAGTQRDTMADHASITVRYGVGMLAANVSAGATTLVANVENAAIAAQLYHPDPGQQRQPGCAHHHRHPIGQRYPGHHPDHPGPNLRLHHRQQHSGRLGAQPGRYGL